ncbi:MAG: type VI secretion system-associated protein TagF [Chromatiaceae bacterium]|nr:type VI secretion system-associated protein TagF [Chromatiaceae bacterium]
MQAGLQTPEKASGDGQVPGFYGKFPTLGDFVSRRLPSQFIQPWDQWLQQALTESRGQLGDDWLSCYLVSPLWRFVLSPGIAGQVGWAGLLMPSVDRVGRYFPLTLARSLTPETDGFSLLSASDWFGEIEQLALSSLDDGFDLQDFDRRLSSIPAPPLTVRPVPVTADTARKDAWQLSAASDVELQQACPTLLQRALDDSFLGYSFWWSEGSDRVAPSLLTCQGLPPPDGFAAMLAGDWSAGGWTQLGQQSGQRQGQPG